MSERRLRILDRLANDQAAGLETRRLCAVCADVTDMTGAGIMLMSDGANVGSLCTTNPVSALLEQLQFDLGEGPCVDAFTTGEPVLEPDLASPETERWVAFTQPAVAAGVRAVFGFPLHVGEVKVGALNLYRDRPGPLGDENHADALVMADVAAEAILFMQSDAPEGTLAAELEASAEFRWVVHQAAGMLAVQLQVTVHSALLRLRAHAFGLDRAVAEVARDVVSRDLRFDRHIDGALE